MKNLPTLKLEIGLWEKGYTVVGIDEVGRGSFAGPLVVGAVVFNPGIDKNYVKKLESFGINDSKKLLPKKREMLTKIIQEYSLFSALEYIDHRIINDLGIGSALKIGFRNIAEQVGSKLPKAKLFFLTDAYKIQGIDNNLQLNIIRGDATSLSIAAASIVAKVDRDNHMREVSKLYPDYGFEKHKGYGTLFHRNKLKEYGSCPIHRAEFVKSYI